jgi:site-specific DNA-cytosine methylase
MPVEEWDKFENLPYNAKKRIINHDYQTKHRFPYNRVVDKTKPMRTMTTNHSQSEMYIVDAVNHNANGKDRVRSVYEQLYTVVCRQSFFLCDLDSYRFRKLSVEELSRIMGFPKDYVFVGTKFDRISQIGNAVCPPVAKAIGESILRHHKAGKPTRKSFIWNKHKQSSLDNWI